MNSDEGQETNTENNESQDVEAEERSNIVDVNFDSDNNFDCDCYSESDGYTCSDSDEHQCVSNEGKSVSNSNFKQSLKAWALTHNITHSAINDLLKLLRPTSDDLPVDARTLLGTSSYHSTV